MNPHYFNLDKMPDDRELGVRKGGVLGLNPP